MGAHSPDRDRSTGRLPPGTALGPYVIQDLLGAGGMGEVHRAHDRRLGRDVAVKVLPPAAGENADRLRRFQVEARATAALSHPNILAVYDIGDHEGTPYLVTELLEGESLRQRMSSGFVTVHDAVEVAIQTARALSAAHEQGVVHRDLKPGNLFLSRAGHLKVLDFGLARLTRPEAELDSLDETEGFDTDTGAVLGTVGYMAPEQVRGETADARADIFALGVVLYELLARRPPFSRTTQAETMSAVLRDDPAPLTSSPGVPPALAHIVDRCLAKRPEERFQSAHDLALALEAVFGVCWSEPPSGTASAPRRRGRRLVLLAGAIVVAAVAATVSLRQLTAVPGFPVTTTPSPVPRPPQNRVVVLPFVGTTGDPELAALPPALGARVWSAVANVPDVDMVTVAEVAAAVTSAGPDGAASAVNAGVEVSGTAFVEGSGLRLQASVRDLVSGHLHPPAEAVCPTRDTSVCGNDLATRIAEIVDLQVHMPRTLLILNRLPSYEAYRALDDGDEERALALDPAVGLSHRENQIHELGNSGDREGAVEAAQAVLDNHGRDLSEFGGRLFTGILFEYKLQDLVALRNFRKAVELEPSSLDARANLADAAIFSNRPEEAVAAFSDVAPEDNFYGWKVVRALVMAGEFERAVEAAETFHAHFPQWQWIDQMEVQALAGLGRLEEMERVLERRLVRPRGDNFPYQAAPAQTMLQAADELLLRGDEAAARALAKRALNVYRQALDGWSSVEATEQNLAQRTGLIGFLDRAGYGTEAQALCTELLTEAPDDARVLSSCAILAARSGDRAEATRLEAALVRADTAREEETTYNRACIAAILGDAERAVELLRQSISQGFAGWTLLRRDPDLAGIRDHPVYKEIIRPKG